MTEFTAKVVENGRITIDKEVRNKEDIEEGDRVSLKVVDVDPQSLDDDELDELITWADDLTSNQIETIMEFLDDSDMLNSRGEELRDRLYRRFIE